MPHINTHTRTHSGEQGVLLQSLPPAFASIHFIVTLTRGTFNTMATNCIGTVLHPEYSELCVVNGRVEGGAETEAEDLPRVPGIDNAVVP